MKLKHTLIAVAIATSLPLFSQEVSKTFHVAKPGTLVEMMTEAEANEITHLTLQGKLNAIDFRHLRDEFKNLQVLDISAATISTYAGKGGTFPDKFYIYPANCIPAYAFCTKVNDSTYVGKESLTRIILSEKTKNLEDAAFKGCNNLSACQINKKEAPNLLPEALSEEVNAIFVPQGSSSSYRNKPKWEGFAIIEGTPVTAHIQIALMESLASELLKAGIQPKEVNFLTIEGKMDVNDFTVIRDYMPNLVSVNLEKVNISAIPDFTFTQKKYLLNVVLPTKLERIGQRAFSGCTRLGGTLVLPSGVTAIEYGAFMGCDKLKSVVATGNQITTLGDNLFGDEENKLIYIK